MKKTVLSNFGILYRTYIDYMKEVLKNTDISFSESIVLMNISERKVTQDLISRNLRIDKAAIARSVKALEQKGYLTTRKNAEDQRNKNLILTAQGESLQKQIAKANQKRIEALKKGVPDDEWEIFHRVLTQLCDNAIAE